MSRVKRTGYNIAEATARYEVVVGNVGTVYVGNDVQRARETMQTYIEQSKSHVGRAGDENVTLFKSGDIVDEYIGTLNEE